MTGIKICGLTRAEDTRLAVSAGADYLGFIFSRSPRRITPEKAAEIGRDLPLEVVRVGVFVNENKEFILAAVREAGLSLIQLHGDESPGLCLELERRLGVPVIKALRAGDREIFETISAYETGYILLEPHVPGLYGGTGKTAGWPLAREIIRTFPGKKFFLAGGLSPENVDLALHSVRPFAVDASSGLEDSPGIKNHEKVKQFIKAVRAYDSTG